MIKVIIADDSPRPRDFLYRVLTRAGFEVIAQCNDGGEAVSACGRLKPDVVVLDVLMKKKNGSEAALEIRKLYPNIKVILASSAAQGAISRPLIAAGCTFVAKPYNDGAFLIRLKEVLADGGTPTSRT